jgi:hypothetical protein
MEPRPSRVRLHLRRAATVIPSYAECMTRAPRPAFFTRVGERVRAARPVATPATA